MAFLPLNYEDGQLIWLPMSNGGSSATYSVGQALMISSGYYASHTAASGETVEAVCMEAGTVTTDGTLLKCISTRGVKFLADTNGVPTVASYQGTYCDLSGDTGLVLDETTSTEDLFFIEKVHGPVANKKVIGYFQHGTPLA
jgi:hypothetical protein